MNYLSFSVSTADIASSIDTDGNAFAELFNELTRDRPMSPRFLLDFAEALGDGGRGLLLQLSNAVVALDAEER